MERPDKCYYKTNSLQLGSVKQRSRKGTFASNCWTGSSHFMKTYHSWNQIQISAGTTQFYLTYQITWLLVIFLADKTIRFLCTAHGVKDRISFKENIHLLRDNLSDACLHSLWRSMFLTWVKKLSETLGSNFTLPQVLQN